MTASNTSINVEFKILSAIGIILVICGHYGISAFTFGNLYKYDTFHMPLFIFISGYFFKKYNSISLSNVAYYIRKKTLHLLFPYMIWNFIYGIIAQFLTKNPFFQFTIGNNIPFSIKTFIIRPFQMGNGFIINVAAWFLITLFLVEIVTCLLQYFFYKLNLHSDIMQLSILFIIGYLGILIAQSPWESAWKISITRVMYLMFWFEFGLCYRKIFEAIDTKIKHHYSLIINITLSCALVFSFGNQVPIVYTATFPNNPIVTILRALLGILLWIRIVKILTPLLKNNNIIMYISNHTFSLMMHQGLVGLCINSTIFITHKIFDWFPDFDVERFKSVIWFAYTKENLTELHILYVFLIVSIILSSVYLWNKIKRKFPTQLSWIKFKYN